MSSAQRQAISIGVSILLGLVSLTILTYGYSPAVLPGPAQHNCTQFPITTVRLHTIS